jgi:hypothetical protein
VDFSDEATDLDASEPQPAPTSSDAPLGPSPELASPVVAPQVAAPAPVVTPPQVVAAPRVVIPPPVVAPTPLVPSGAICTGCGGALKVTDQFCTRCGTWAGGPSTASGGPAHAGFVPPPVNAGAACARCGQALGPGQVQCHRCGSPVAGQVGLMVSTPKDKSVAVLLAVFLSFWSWLYTYQRDKQKFWTGLGVGIGSVVFGTFLLFPLVIPFGIWIWAIVDVCQKPDAYYRQFPQG